LTAASGIFRAIINLYTHQDNTRMRRYAAELREIQRKMFE